MSDIEHLEDVERLTAEIERLTAERDELIGVLRNIYGDVKRALEQARKE